MSRLGETLVQQRDDVAPLVRRQYAQALIERGELPAAQSVLEALVPLVQEDPVEKLEVYGLIGRLHKQRYVEARLASDALRTRTLRKAIDAYLTVFDAKVPKTTWHGINVVALLKRAQRDNVTLPSTYPKPEALADEILRMLAVGRDEWGAATAAEAHLALGQIDRALDMLKEYVDSRRVDAFECNSTLRQLVEVWQLVEGTQAGVLLPVLRVALLERTGGRVDLSVGELQAATESTTTRKVTLERVFGDAKPQLVTWYEAAIARSRAVARIEDATGHGIGTGFLLRAADILPGNDRQRDELVLLTNAHVIGKTHPDALAPEDAVIRFEKLDGQQRTFKVQQLLFESPVAELDTTVVQLDGAVLGVEPLPLAAEVEPVFDAARPRHFFAIGHPLGGAMTLSAEDTLQVGWKMPRLHYRTPTDAGSSGSPIFNDQWQLVAIHHGGGDALNKLDGTGVYQANEAFWIHAVRARIAEQGSTPLASTPIKAPLREGVFVSYSHKDHEWLERLQIALAPLKEKLTLWDDTKIRAGAEWEREIEKGIDGARIAVLLVSQHFLASEFIGNKEIPRILNASRNSGLTVLWVPISATSYQHTFLRDLQAAYDPKHPLNKLSDADRDQVFVDIVEQILAAKSLSELQNALSVADHIGLAKSGMGGTRASLSEFGVQTKALDARIEVHGGRLQIITAAELQRLPDEQKQLISAKEGAMRAAYERYLINYPHITSADPSLRLAAQQAEALIKRDLCRELNGILDFVHSLGKDLNDHYQHVRFLCAQAGPA
jgi:V8-like Glu-specific endopeptidase